MQRHSNRLTQGTAKNCARSRRLKRRHHQSASSRLLRGLFVAVFLVCFSASPGRAANIVVNTNDDNDDGVCDSNHCSLREAINYANALPGPDEITFNTGPIVIYPNSVLPPLIDDGTTIRGDQDIVLNGSNQTGVDGHGLVIRSSYNRIQGLRIRDFSSDGIVLDPIPDYPHADHNVIGVDGDGENDALEGNVVFDNHLSGVRINDNYTNVTTADHNVIAGNIIGLDPSGTVAHPNGHGISMFVYASYNRIGTDFDGISDVLERNVISGNSASGVALPQYGGSNKVQGNYIGTDITGTIGIGNAYSGVSIYRSDHNLVRGNLISANGSNGVSLGGASMNAVLGNKIGTDVTGTQDLGNGFNGIRIFGVQNHPAVHNQVGFAGNYIEEFIVDPNIIAFNDWNGIFSDSHTEGFSAYDNAFLYNSIFENDLLGIDLVASGITACTDGVTPNDANDADGGANGALNFPDITYAKTDSNNTYLSASMNAGLPGSWFIVQFFASPTPDPTGYGEGATYLGQAYLSTDANGNGTTGFVSLNTPTPVGHYITCTATLHDQWGPIATSEFSEGVEVTLSLISAHLDLIKKLMVILDGFMEQDDMERLVVEPLIELLDGSKAALIAEDVKTAQVLMEEFDWWLKELVLADESLPRDVGDELQKLTDQLTDILQTADDEQSRERS